MYADICLGVCLIQTCRHMRTCNSPPVAWYVSTYGTVPISREHKHRTRLVAWRTDPSTCVCVKLCRWCLSDLAGLAALNLWQAYEVSRLRHQSGADLFMTGGGGGLSSWETVICRSLFPALKLPPSRLLGGSEFGDTARESSGIPRASELAMLCDFAGEGMSGDDGDTTDHPSIPRGPENSTLLQGQRRRGSFALTGMGTQRTSRLLLGGSKSSTSFVSRAGGGRDQQKRCLSRTLSRRSGTGGLGGGGEGFPTPSYGRDLKGMASPISTCHTRRDVVGVLSELLHCLAFSCSTGSASSSFDKGNGGGLLRRCRGISAFARLPLRERQWLLALALLPRMEPKLLPGDAHLHALLWSGQRLFDPVDVVGRDGNFILGFGYTGDVPAVLNAGRGGLWAATREALKRLQREREMERSAEGAGGGRDEKRHSGLAEGGSVLNGRGGLVESTGGAGTLSRLTSIEGGLDSNNGEDTGGAGGGGGGGQGKAEMNEERFACLCVDNEVGTLIGRDSVLCSD